jgi:hypothetical protein
MKKILLIVLGVFVALVAGLCVVVAMQPSEFSITRSGTMKAPVPVVFEQVNTLKNWESWSPWAKLDPNMKLTYSGPESGTGAVYAWEGDGNVGAGRLAITDSKPNERIDIQLDFYKPMEGTNATVFTFAQAGEQTTVTWTMSGKNNFLAKAIGLMMDMDVMVGGMFEQGLSQLRSVSEGSVQ